MESIIRTQSKAEKYFEEDCYITELLNTEDLNDVSISQAKVKPGVTTVLHKLLETNEKYYIISGEGEMEIGGNKVGKVVRGDVVVIPAGTSQRIKNTGGSDLVFLCICTPRFKVANYVSLE